MKSSLYEIQDVAIQIADAMAVMLQVDVEIIDCDHMRVAGTGHFRDSVNKSNIHEGHAYRDVLQTGEKLFVKDPARSRLCEGCPEREHCEVRLEVGGPIIVDDKIEGVIGLTCWKKEREAFFLEHFEDSVYFLEQMCALVAGKIKERRTMQKNLSAGKMLRTVMRLVDKGVIMLDREGKLSEYNRIAEKELKLSSEMTGQFVNILLTGDTMTEKQEYKVIVGSDVHTVIGHEEKFDDQNEQYGSILIFDSIREYRNRVYNMVHYVSPHDINAIIGHSVYVERLKKEILQTGANNSPVLIEGEEGVGKKVVGTAIWKASQRAEKPFVYFNCAGVAEEMYEERLFGCSDRSIDGEERIRRGTIGVIEMANEGILYLDEIDELPVYYQTKLEQVLEERVIQRKGSYQKIPVNVRIIAATKKNLLKLIEKNKFRKPFYYMICISKISVTPLRKRKEDIPEIVHFYIEQYSKKYNAYVKEITPDTMEFLQKCNWYGNVTELEKTVEYMVNALTENGIVDLNTVPLELKEQEEDAEENNEDHIMTLEQVEQREIRKAMAKFGDSKKGKEQAAEALGIGIATLYRKLERMS